MEWFAQLWGIFSVCLLESGLESRLRCPHGYLLLLIVLQSCQILSQFHGQTSSRLLYCQNPAVVSPWGSTASRSDSLCVFISVGRYYGYITVLFLRDPYAF